MSSGDQPLRVLVVATKCPWPSTDGGRLVLAETLRAVADAGAEITLVSPGPEKGGDKLRPYSPGVSRASSTNGSAGPNAASSANANHTGVDPSRHIAVGFNPRPWISTLLRPSTPATIVRQANDASLDAVERLVGEKTFDVAHAEQLHALPLLAPARKRGIPIVLRAQNVESDLWEGAARAMPWASPWLLLQAALLRRWEGRAVASTTLTAALTESDVARLSNLAKHHGEVVHVPAPFPRTLPAGPRLAGTPALVVSAGGWIPNHDGARWFLQRVWPLVLDRLPAAQLHLFGARAERLPRSTIAYPTAPDSAELFPDGGIHVVPLRVASGVRMKILEAWSRGVPVVASNEAATGLAHGADAALLRESDPVALAIAIENLAHDPDLRETLVAAGRRVLEHSHDPATIGKQWIDLYRHAARARPAASIKV